MLPDHKLSQQCAFMDRLSEAVTQSPAPLTVEEGQRLAALQGVVASPSIIAQACEGASAVTVPSVDLGWKRPVDRADLDRILAAANANLARHTRRRSGYWFLTAAGLGVTFLASGLYLFYVSHHDPRAHEAFWAVLCGLAVSFGTGMLGQVSAIMHDLDNQIMETWSPATPTQHQVRKWSSNPRLWAYLQQCCASEVGLLQGDVTVLERAWEKGAPEDQAPADLTHLGTLEERMASEVVRGH